MAAAFAAASSASAQACLSLSDGAGNVTVSCPDGRSGYLHADPGGVASGMIGTSPYSLPSAAYAPLGTPGAAYAQVPAPPPPLSLPPPAAVEPPPAFLPSPAPQLTPLQQEYLAQEVARRAAAEEARRAAQDAKP